VPALLLLAAAVLAQDTRELGDLRNLDRTLRFALERNGRAVDSTVAVYLDRGVFAPSGLAVVRRLDERKRPPRLLFRGDLRADGLKGVATLFVPGGWAPSIRAGMGPEGRAAVKAFVKAGGRYAGICAGSYLACRDVVWANERFDYPIGLAHGTAIGPLDAIAAWPKAASVKVAGRSTLYSGGCRFVMPGAKVLGTYPDKTPAIIATTYGKGTVVLTGVHVEFVARKDKDLLARWADGVACDGGPLFDLLPKRS
jgi:putative intracellular protease/amidase